MQIEIDVTDWNKEYTDAELNLEDKAVIFDAMFSNDLSAVEMTKLYIIARERGVTDETFLPGNKSLLLNGGTHSLSAAVASITERVMTPTGKQKARKVIAPVHKKAIDDELESDIWIAECGSENEPPEGEQVRPSVVKKKEPHNAFIGTPLGLQRAIDYLLNVVTGHIKGRLPIIYASGGNVSDVLNELRAKIDEMEQMFIEK